MTSKKKASSKGAGKPAPDPLRVREKQHETIVGLRLESLKDRVIAGDGFAIVDALSLAAEIDCPLPRWLAVPVGVAMTKYLFAEVKTLDEAFGVKRPKSFSLSTARRRLMKSDSVYFDICFLHCAGVAVSQELYSCVGEMHSLSNNKKVADCYNEGKEKVGDSFHRTLFSTHLDPSELPDRLRKCYQDLTGKRIKASVPTKPKKMGMHT